MSATFRIYFLFLLLAFVPVTLTSDIRVTIIPQEKRLTKPAGSDFVATCKGEAEDPTLFTDMKWIGPNGPISEDAQQPVSVLQGDGNLFLTFNKPTREMSGTYNCTAVYDNSKTVEDTMHITFYHAISFEDCSKVQSLIINRPGKIRCRVNANPNADLTWSKGDGPDKSLEKTRYEIQNDGIWVTDVRETDSGLYVLRALVQQTGELRVREITVEVHVPPEITELEENVKAIEGERTELACHASGNPPPLYSWFDPLQRNLSSVDGYIVNRDSGVLTIREVRKEDAGVYKCMAENSADRANGTSQLTVLVKPEVREFNNVTQVQDKDVLMECRCTGDPKPEMSIRKDGHDQPLASGDDRIKIKTIKNDNGEYVLQLTIFRVIRTDDGLYYCSAKNDVGRAERVGHLTVEFAPDMMNTPATERKTWNDNQVNLTCVAEAIPNATITWFFRNQQIVNDETYRIYGTTSMSSLLVRPSPGRPGGLDVYGKYRCEGRNQLGNSSIEINLEEARVPSRIQQIMFDKQTATTITFHLRGIVDDGGLPIKYYVIKYYEDGMGLDEEKTYEWIEGIPYILEKLKPRTKYIFRFAAKNDAGIGEFSEEKVFITLAESAPDAPIFVTPGGNISRYPDNFQVRWVVPQSNGKPIQKFNLRCFRVEQVGTDWKNAGDDVKDVDITQWQSGASYKITGLMPSSYYKVELRAYNEIGFSQPGSMIFQTAVGSRGEEQQRLEGGGGILTTSAIVAIVIVVVLVVLGLLDVTCYLRYHCGLFYCLRTSICGRSQSSSKAKEAVEDGKGDKELLSTNCANNGRADGPPIISSAEERPALINSNSFPKNCEDIPNKTTEVDNPAFDKDRPIHVDGQLPGEDTPMIESMGAKDTKSAGDVNSGDYKNKSPKGSKSSIAKDSLV